MAATVYLSLIFLTLYLIGLALQRWWFRRDRARMAAETRQGGRVIARVDDISPGSVKKFWLICQKYRLDGFLINDRGSFHAYVNRCRHMPTPLDFVRDQFISEDGQFLRCYTHGALYEFSRGHYAGCFLQFLLKSLAITFLPIFRADAICLHS